MDPLALIPSKTPPEDEEDERTYRRHCDLVSTLPEDSRWRAMRQFQGFWFIDGWLPSILAAREHFQARPTDVFVASVPKSGTTWLKSLAFSVAHRGRHPPHDEHHPVRRANPHDLVYLLDELYRWRKNPDLAALPPPRIFFTQTPYSVLPATVRDAGCRIVFIARDPKDNFVSYWHFMQGLEAAAVDGVRTVPLDEALDMFCAGITNSGPFWEHVLEYWNEHVEHPGRVFFLKYEVMKGDPVGSLRELAAFLGCPFTAAEEERGVPEGISELCSFGSLSNLGVNRDGVLGKGRSVEKKLFFRKGEVGDWRNHLTPAMAEKVDKITREKLSGSGLNF